MKTRWIFVLKNMQQYAWKRSKSISTTASLLTRNIPYYLIPKMAVIKISIISVVFSIVIIIEIGDVLHSILFVLFRINTTLHRILMRQTIHNRGLHFNKLNIFSRVKYHCTYVATTKLNVQLKGQLMVMNSQTKNLTLKKELTGSRIYLNLVYWRIRIFIGILRDQWKYSSDISKFYTPVEGEQQNTVL